MPCLWPNDERRDVVGKEKFFVIIPVKQEEEMVLRMVHRDALHRIVNDGTNPFEAAYLK